MSAALKDLPDPLDPSPAMALSNPDDLLAKMADEAIDRLMAEADKGTTPTLPPVPMDAVADVTEPAAAAGDAAAAGAAERGVTQAKADPGSSGVDDSARRVAVDAAGHADAAAHAVAPHASDAAAHSESLETSGVAADTATVGDTTLGDATASAAAEHDAAEHADLHAAASPGPPAPAADVRALLQDHLPPTPTRPSPWLWPLWLLNLPFSGMSDDARRIFGLLGVVTLVPAATAIFFVIWMKRH